MLKPTGLLLASCLCLAPTPTKGADQPGTVIEAPNTDDQDDGASAALDSSVSTLCEEAEAENDDAWEDR